ncbi:hypothetical protein AJ80_03925 [Polytolypa hystricis UAMH7299]|uniref:F-box domain-containing protein n=1 Tax=Polytolypa hystricis (strain UAMH7299) TaxID=1447883 RepID=A0A2B7YDT7_POLH7|nr:hypothetical protein AJ80_03925 [Polytolypa hystricis UAMH7299]
MSRYQTRPSARLTTIPNELLLDIVDLLQLKDLCKLIQTSRGFWHALADKVDTAAMTATCTCSQPPFYREEKVSILGWAASKGLLGLVDRLLAMGANPLDPWLPGPLTRAARGGHSAVVARFVSVGAHHGKSFTLLDAVWSGDVETVRVLVDSGFNANCGNFTVALQRAVLNGNIDITAFLLDSANAIGRMEQTIQEAGFELLASAIQREDRATVTLLLESGADPLEMCTKGDQYGHTPMLVAVQTGNVEMLRLVAHAIPSPADALSARCETSRMTPLHFAAMDRHSDMVEELVRIGAPIDSKDINNMTPLHLAAMNGDEYIARILVNAGANIQARTSAGRTPQSFAAENAYLECLELLRDARTGNTPRTTTTGTGRGTGRMSRFFDDNTDEDASINGKGAQRLSRLFKSYAEKPLFSKTPRLDS